MILDFLIAFGCRTFAILEMVIFWENNWNLWSLRIKARNSKTSPEELRALAVNKDLDWWIRCDLIDMCGDHPLESFMVGIKDESWHVRCTIVMNPFCPPEALAIAIRDENAQVRWLAMHNPNFDADKIREILLR